MATILDLISECANPLEWLERGVCEKFFADIITTVHNSYTIIFANQICELMVVGRGRPKLIISGNSGPLKQNYS